MCVCVCVCVCRWDMDFSVNKYEVMHMGKRNLEFSAPDGWVKLVDGEKHLGLLVSKDLKFSTTKKVYCQEIKLI